MKTWERVLLYILLIGNLPMSYYTFRFVVSIVEDLLL
jgi:hypothetical protein